MLADDNATNRKLGVLMLRRLGYEIDLANDGQQAIDACANNYYDIVYMDIEMPEVDGFEATKIIREQHNHPDLRIVAMTANAMRGAREECIAAGMDDYIAKPIKLEHLVRTLNLKTVRQESEATPPRSSQVIDPSAIDTLLEMIGGDKEAIQELIDSYLSEAPKLVTQLETGLQNQDNDLIRRAAHTLKSSSNDFGAYSLGELCKELETACRDGSLDFTLATDQIAAVDNLYREVAEALANS